MQSPITMSQSWDYPGPGEDPNNIWKDLKDSILPEDKQDSPSDIWEDLNAAVLPVLKDDNLDDIWGEFVSALPENDQETPEDIWVELQAAILPAPANKDNNDSNRALIPEIKVTPASSSSEQAQSSKDGENGSTQSEESDTLIPEVEVTVPTTDSESVPTSDESEYVDAREEVDTPSVSEAKGEQKEVKDEEETAHISDIPDIEGFERSDIAAFLSLGDNDQVREKLAAILREGGSKTTGSDKAEDEGLKLKGQGSWGSQVAAADKSGIVSKDSSSDESGGSRELKRIRTELDVISRMYEPNLGLKDVKLKRQGSWPAELRAAFKPVHVANSAMKKEVAGNINSVESPSSPKARKKSIIAWVAEVKAAFESASATESAASSEVIGSSDSQSDERDDSSEKPEGAQFKRDPSYLAVEVKTMFALAATTKSLPSIETESTKALDEPESNTPPVKGPGSGQADLTIDGWIAGIEDAAEETRELNSVPDEKYEINKPSEKQNNAPVINKAKKPNWISRNQGASSSMEGPSPTISWDFWAEDKEDTSNFKEVCRKTYDILSYPMSRIAVDGKLPYQSGDWREDLPYESLNEGPQLNSTYGAIKHLCRRSESVTPGSSVVNMGKAV